MSGRGNNEQGEDGGGKNAFHGIPSNQYVVFLAPSGAEVNLL